jgi:oligoendopeptidase F
MNAAGTIDDVITMVHEAGHAAHSFLCHAQPLSAFKNYPMEIAEVASMSMELISMQHWNTFLPLPAEHARAQWDELERIITIFPWIAMIDKFQHWIYTNPTHTPQQRNQQWQAIHTEFDCGTVNWTQHQTQRQHLWQKQLHIFEVPFYYIEYGIAQLGAIGIWQAYKQNPQTALQQYFSALSLGNTRTLPQLYQTAGIPFTFSENHISQLMQFVHQQLKALSTN